MKNFLLIVCCLLWVGCSTLPKKIESQALTFANMKMKFAYDAQKKRDFDKALFLYQEAYQLFTRIDDLEGKVKSGISIARQLFYLEKDFECKQWIQLVNKIINIHLPQMIGALTILKLEMAFFKENYQKIIEIAEVEKINNSEGQSEILCYLMIAKENLKMNYSSELKYLHEKLPKLRKRFFKRRLNEPNVLGFLYYYVGYIYFKEKKWESALYYFEEAKNIDGILDQSFGLGKDLYSMGMCYEKMKRFKEAISCYERSMEVFNICNEQEMLKKLKTHRDKLLKN